MTIFFLDLGSIFKSLEVMIMSGLKFVFAPFLSYSLDFNYFQTIVLTSLGGIIGIFFFYLLSKRLIKVYSKMYFIKNFFRIIKKSMCSLLNIENYEKKKFSRKNKLIVKVMNKYGLIGLAVLTPVLLSIPLGAFLASKYFSGKNKKVLVYLSASIVTWSFVISTIFEVIK